MVSAQTSAAIAKELSRCGHSVRIFAPFPSRPQGRLYKGYTRSLYSTKMMDDGCVLTSCFGTFSPSSTMLSRFAENLSFGISSGLRTLLCKRPDVIYSNTWPIFATGIVAIIARLRGIPLVLSVQDAYPESLESQERSSTRQWLYRLLKRMDAATSRSAAQIVVISDRFRRLYAEERGIEADRLHVIPNWGKEDFIATDTSRALAFRRRLGIADDAFVAVYAGNVGMASNAEMLVDVFDRLKNHRKLFLVIAGDGSRLPTCREEIERKQLDNVIIHSPWKVEETGSVLQMADVLLLPTKRSQSLSSIPSKLISYLLSARPVIAAVLPESDTALTLLATGAGWVVDPDSSEIIAHAIIRASGRSKDTLNQMGAAGREYALHNLTREFTLPRVLHVILKAAGFQGVKEKLPQGVSLSR
ncbi:glycosyltransferase family 4 protein [Alloacidobacterium dinghuense]|nr:glycosyltransferase family 4 protein [Alloacidobacterium dinghuense]